MRAFTIGLIAASVFSTSASAQVADHLKCYKIKDPVRLRGVADLDTAQYGLGPGCRISPARLYCVPADKTVAQVKDRGVPFTPLSFSAPPAQGDRICYNVRCPLEPLPPDTEVTDQFGTRTATRLRAKMLCTPATEGASFCGDGVLDVGEECDVGNDAACPGACEPGCTCPTPSYCGDGTQNGSEQCDGSDFDPGLICGGGCLADCRCRFVDDGDGTVIDNQTGLLWEKKTDDTTVHDKDNSYTWSASGGAPDGTAFTSLLATLNDNGGGTCAGGGPMGGCCSNTTCSDVNCFAGHCDWRLPTSMELQSILLTQAPCGLSPCINAIFGPTQAVQHWSSTTSTWSYPEQAWWVGFDTGSVNDGLKANSLSVRAVRTRSDGG